MPFARVFTKAELPHCNVVQNRMEAHNFARICKVSCGGVTLRRLPPAVRSPNAQLPTGACFLVRDQRKNRESIPSVVVQYSWSASVAASEASPPRLSRECNDLPNIAPPDQPSRRHHTSHADLWPAMMLQTLVRWLLVGKPAIGNIRRNSHLKAPALRVGGHAFSAKGRARPSLTSSEPSSRHAMPAARTSFSESVNKAAACTRVGNKNTCVAVHARRGPHPTHAEKNRRRCIWAYPHDMNRKSYSRG